MNSFNAIIYNINEVVQLDEEEIMFFRSLVEIEQIPKKTIYYRMEDQNNCLYFVNKGLSKCYVLDKEQREVIIYFPKEGWWVADLDCFYFKKPSRFQYETLEDSEVFSITNQNIDILFKRYPKFEHFFHNKLIKYIINFHERYINLLTKTAKERYELFSDLYPDLVQRVPQKSIASYLGVTPEFLSKMRGLR